MKKMITTIGLALAFASVSFAQNWGYTTPRPGGGYNFYPERPLEAETLPALTGSSLTPVVTANAAQVFYGLR